MVRIHMLECTLCSCSLQVVTDLVSVEGGGGEEEEEGGRGGGGGVRC